MVAGLVQGLLEGNRMVRDDPEQHLDVIGRAFKWTARGREGASWPRCTRRTCPRTSRSSRARSTPPAASAGSTSRPSRLRQRPDQGPAGRRAASSTSRRCRRSTRRGSSRTRRSRSRRSAAAAARRSRPTRCSARTSGSCSSRTPSDARSWRTQENLKNLEAIKRLLQVSPGSTLLLRGHVDNAQIEEFRKQGGEALVRTQALERDGVEQEPRGRDQAAADRALQRRRRSASRSSAAAGKSRPGPNSDLNRRVEVQWFTIE